MGERTLDGRLHVLVSLFTRFVVCKYAQCTTKGGCQLEGACT